jgi:sarcosine oxidase
VEGPQYVPMLRVAYDGWRELERETGQSLLTLTGGLTIGDPAAATMRAVRECVIRYGLDHEMLDDVTARARYPQHRLFPGEAMVLEARAGIVRSEAAVLAAIRRAERLGAIVYRHAPVESIVPTAHGIPLRVDGADHQFGKVLIAVGPWTGSLLPAWQPTLAVRRLVMTWFAADDPAAYTPERFPVFTRHHDASTCSACPASTDTPSRSPSTRNTDPSPTPTPSTRAYVPQTSPP